MSSTTSSSFSPLDGGVIALNVKARVKPEHREGLLDVLTIDAKGTRNDEPGGLQFVIGQDVTDANTIFLHEQYKSMADFEYHQKTPHFQKVLSFLEASDPLEEPMMGNVYRCQHPPKEYLETTSSTRYCLNVESSIKPELRDEFVELMTNHQLKSKQEPLCVQFDWGVSIDDENTFYIHEEYVGNEEGKEGFLAHEASPHFAKFVKFNNEKQPYSKPQVVQFFKLLPL